MATHTSVLACEVPWREEPGVGAIVHGVAKSQTRLSTAHPQRILGISPPHPFNWQMRNWRPYISVSLTVSLKVSFKVVIIKHTLSP